MKKVFIFLIVLVFGVFLHGFTMAQIPSEDITPPDTLMLGMIEGTGTHFEITDSDYLNVVLESSETITLRLESVPEMVTMHIEPASEATLTQITIGGFQPSTTYYKYEDDYHNEVAFTTDGNGGYSWTQDLSQPHLAFIQPRKSTKFIKDNATGGDCYLIGNWVWTTKTCTLTKDVYESIQIDSNYITLDGNGHTVTGTRTGSGIYLYGGTGVTIKNLNVKNFSRGIFLLFSRNDNLAGNIASNNYDGIVLYASSGNKLNNNIASNNGTGIVLSRSTNNTLAGNITSNNIIHGISLSESSNHILTDNITQENSVLDLNINADCNNVIQNTTGSGGRPIKYFSSSVNLENETLSQLILCNADYSNINNVTIEGSETLKNNGLFFIGTDYSKITNTNSSNNLYGIYFVYSNNNNLNGNTTSNNQGGILLLSSSSNNALIDNAVSNNEYYGIALRYRSNNNILTRSTISNSSWGFFLDDSSDNKIYNNNLIGNRTQAYVFGSSGNIFNLEKPIGGNYRNDFDTPGEGCYDTNNDGFCDAPYRFYGGVDYLPWTKQSGWEVPADTISPTTTVILSGTLGNNDWYVSDIQVTLTAMDNEGGSGVKITEYSFDGSTWNTYSSPFAISKEGTTTVYYRSTDNAGNVETTKNTTVKIDKTPPTIPAVTATPSTLWPPNHKIVDVRIDGSASDDISGIASVVITVADEYGIYNMTVPGFGSMIQLEAWRDGTDKDGRVYTVTVVVTDIAGNQSTATTQVTVPHDMRK